MKLLSISLVLISVISIKSELSSNLTFARNVDQDFFGEFYNQFDDDDYMDFESEGRNNYDNDDIDSADDSMYEDDTQWRKRKSFFTKKMLQRNILRGPVVYDENWPYPDGDEIRYRANRTATSSRFACGTCKCGVRKTKRIIGGSIVKNPLNYPWMVKVTYRRSFICGGSVINSRHVLTAAHCASGLPRLFMGCIFQEHKKNSIMENAKQIHRSISRYFIHKKFSFRTLNNDIALLKLKSKINSFSMLTPICLPYKNLGNWGGNNKKAWVTGWGDTTISPATSILSSRLKQVKVRVLKNRECNRIYGGHITKKMICAGSKGRDSCKGDSGGPMIVNNKRILGRWKQLGIVSHGIRCGINPGVYTRVPRFLNWIVKKSSENACWCQGSFSNSILKIYDSAL